MIKGLESACACIGPPMPSINSALWSSLISSLEIGLDSTKDAGNLERFIEKYKDKEILSFQAIKKDVETFLDFIEEENKRIIGFYRNKKEIKFEMPKKICGNISSLDIQSKLIDYSRMKAEKSSEKFYCKLIADLNFATKIILGKERGPLGSYETSFREVVEYLKYNRPLSWDEENYPPIY